MAQGIEKGRTDEKFEIARKMKEMKLPISRIAEVTGLSSESIERIGG